jgi:hypothetical protein
MAMSRKHYQEAAEIIKAEMGRTETEREKLMLREIAHDFASMFACDNGRFDRDRFLRAAGVRS